MPDSDNTFDPRKIRELRNVKINMGGLKITNLGDATADTDALNRQSGDARYATPDTNTPNTLGSWAPVDAGTYLDARGNEKGVVDITWTDPTTNTDSSALTDLEEIMVSYKRAAATNFTNVAVKVGVQASTVDKLLVGVQYEFKGWCHDTHGHASAFTSSTFVTPGGDTTAPSQPSAPSGVGSSSRGINVIHDLQKAASGNLQDDLSYLLVYFDTDSTIPTAAANLGGEIPATFTEITAGDGVNRTFTKYGTAELVRGSTYYCKVVPVDQAGNKGTASAASAAIVAGAEAGSTAVPPTPTVSARLGGVVAAFNLADGTPDYGPANLDVTSFKLFGGWATAPTDFIGWLHIRREELANSMIVWKNITLPVGTVGTYYVRAQSRNSAGTLSDYGVQGSATVAALGPNDIAADAITANHIDVTDLSVIGNASTGSLSVTGTLTLSGSGQLITVGGYSVGGAVKAVTITAAGPDRITLYSGGNLETAAGYIYADNATNVPYLRIQGPAIAGPASGRIDLWGTAVDITHTTGVRLQLGGVSKLSVTASEISAALDVNPATDNARNLGSATTTWLGIYGYNLYDEAGTERWDLSANMTVAGTIEGSAGTAAAPAIYLNDDVNSGIYQSAADCFGIATAGAAKFEILGTGAHPVTMYIASGMKRVDSIVADATNLIGLRVLVASAI